MDHPLLDTFFASHDQTSPPSELDLVVLNAILAIPQQSMAVSAEEAPAGVRRDPHSVRSNSYDGHVPTALLACSLWAFAAFCHNYSIGEHMVDLIRAARRRRMNRLHQALSRLRRDRRLLGSSSECMENGQHGSPPLTVATASQERKPRRCQRNGSAAELPRSLPGTVEYIELLWAFGHRAVHH